MKTFKIAMLAAATMFAACNAKTTTVSGTINDATMNTVTVATADGAAVTFGTADADRTECNGLTVGSPITVEYTGAIENNFATAKKIATPKEYNLLVGDWTYMNGDFEQGFSLRAEGEAEAIGTATLVYTAWSLDGEKLALAGKSLGNGEEIDFIEVWNIVSLDETTLHITNDGRDLTLTKKAE